MLLNIVLILAVVIVFVYLVFNQIKKKANAEVEQTVNVDDQTYTLNKMTEYIKKRLDEITKVNLYDLGLTEEELKRRKNKKYELKKALKGCTYGDVNDKKYVKELIYDILSKEYGVDETNISKAIPFDIPSLLTAQDKFDILIYMYQKDFGYESMTQLIKKYKLDTLKYVSGDAKPCYVITADEINEIYEKEGFVLNFSDKLNVVVQRIYQHYKGYSSIDEVRDMNIDGISGGVSGLPESFLSQVAQTDSDYLNEVMDHKVPRACDSIWIFFQGKSIRLAFLSFGTEAELKRVCQNIYKYNNPGQLSDTNGYKINEMKDGSRVVVVRPSFSETWAFFVRKFDVKRATLEQLITFPGKEDAIALLKYLVKGARIISLTGEQGCGKTTMLMGMIENIYETMNIRVQETAFELHLRKIYPTRNILTFRETETISGQEGLDVQKKTDGSVNIIGEVATDPVASWMIQAAQVASKFTLFTHHAKTFPDLVTALRNSMLRTGVFTNEKTAEEQVVSVLNFDIHLVKDFKGRRYIERITECIPVKEVNDYTYDFQKEKTLEGKFDKFFYNATKYFTKVTNKELYQYRNIMEYHDGEYVITNKITDHNLQEMRLNMDDNDLAEFDKFVEKHWGKQKADPRRKSKSSDGPTHEIRPTPKINKNEERKIVNDSVPVTSEELKQEAMHNNNIRENANLVNPYNDGQNANSYNGYVDNSQKDYSQGVNLSEIGSNSQNINNSQNFAPNVNSGEDANGNGENPENSFDSLNNLGRDGRNIQNSGEGPIIPDGQFGNHQNYNNMNENMNAQEDSTIHQSSILQTNNYAGENSNQQNANSNQQNLNQSNANVNQLGQNQANYQANQVNEQSIEEQRAEMQRKMRDFYNQMQGNDSGFQGYHSSNSGAENDGAQGNTDSNNQDKK